MMKKLILLPAILLFISGCERTEIVTSAVMTESAVIIDSLYTAPHTTTNTNIAFSMEGDIVLVPTSIKTPEQWGVVFRCQHGKWPIIGSDKRYKTLWETYDKDDEVIIIYKEIYEITYDNENKPINKVLKDYDFLGVRGYDKLQAEKE